MYEINLQLFNSKLRITQKNCAKLKFRFMRNLRKKYFQFCANCAKKNSTIPRKTHCVSSAKIAQKFAKKNLRENSANFAGMFLDYKLSKLTFIEKNYFHAKLDFHAIVSNILICHQKILLWKICFILCMRIMQNAKDGEFFKLLIFPDITDITVILLGALDIKISSRAVIP